MHNTEIEKCLFGIFSAKERSVFSNGVSKARTRACSERARARVYYHLPKYIIHKSETSKRLTFDCNPGCLTREAS